MGDTLVSIPALKLIKSENEKSSITLLSNEPVDGGLKAAPMYDILKNSGIIDFHIEYSNSKSKISIIKKIRKLKPDLVYYLMPSRSIYQSFRDYIFFILCGIYRVKGIFYNIYSINKNRLNNNKSEANRLINSIGFNNIQLSKELFSLNLNMKDRINSKLLINKYNIGSNFIAISIGTKFDVNDWGQPNWLCLIELLSDIAYKYNLVTIGSNIEYDRSQELLEKWGSKNGANLCGLTSPRESASILELASLFIGHDSGPLHLASSVGIEAIGIFSSRNNPGIWFPYGNENNVLYTNIECQGCRLDECSKLNKICIKSIKPIDVAIMIKKRLKI